MSTPDGAILRRLDEAFADRPVTPELRDLREELRSNLLARVSELIAAGAEGDAATDTAVAELGDVRGLIDAVTEDAQSTDPTLSAHSLNRVRPRPAYVVRTVLLSLVLAFAAAVVARAVTGTLDWSATALALVVVLVGAVPTGVTTADALRQETSQHYPMPQRRAGAYGAAAAAAAAGTGCFLLAVDGEWGMGAVVAWSMVLVGALVAFIVLGTTQTNRTKPWVREVARSQAGHDAFSKDPAAAARFGIYTVVIWLLAIAGFVVLSLTVGFAWSWLALVAGLALFMIVLARMLFRPETAR